MPCEIQKALQMKAGYKEKLHFKSDISLTGWEITCIGKIKQTGKEVFNLSLGNGITLKSANAFDVEVSTVGVTMDIEFDIRFAPNDNTEPFPSPTYTILVCKGYA